nr:unnamed protein product [Callosobruchus chinensis]
MHSDVRIRKTNSEIECGKRTYAASLIVICQSSPWKPSRSEKYNVQKQVESIEDRRTFLAALKLFLNGIDQVQDINVSMKRLLYACFERPPNFAGAIRRKNTMHKCRHADLPSLPAIILIRLLVCGACTSFVVNLTLRRRFSTLTGNPSVNQDNSKY